MFLLAGERFSSIKNEQELEIVRPHSFSGLQPARKQRRLGSGELLCVAFGWSFSGIFSIRSLSSQKGFVKYDTIKSIHYIRPFSPSENKNGGEVPNLRRGAGKWGSQGPLEGAQN